MKIYLIEQTIGQYEDRYITVVKAFKDEKMAEDYVKEMNSKYEGISEISDYWDREWNSKVYSLFVKTEPGLSIDEAMIDCDRIIQDIDAFLEFIKEHFPEDYKKFGEEKIRFAHDLYERGQLNEIPFYSIQVTDLVD